MAINPNIAKDSTELIKLFIRRPEVFCIEWLQTKPWDKQMEILYSVRDVHETYVQSCNAAGKSELAAMTILWWITTRRGKVVTTAPTWRQVESILWSKINSYCARNSHLGLSPLKTKLEIEPEWYAQGSSSTTPDNFQGYHGNVLVVVDEAVGVENPDVWAALDGCVTDYSNDRMLAIGNPTDPDSEFARRCKNTVRGRSRNIRISAFDTPNLQAGKAIIPGLITPEFVKAKEEDWGKSSPYYIARILGEFPREASDSLFPLAWLDRAFDYSTEEVQKPDGSWTVEMPDISNGPSTFGVDIAGSGADANALCWRTGGKVQKLLSWHDVDPTEVIISDIETKPSIFKLVDLHFPEVVTIDSNGLGYPIYTGTIKHKRTDSKYKSLKIKPFDSRNTAIKADKYYNRRAEAYLNLRNLLQKNALDLSNIQGEQRDILEKQAAKVRARITDDNRWRIEPKEQMRNREGFSPDELEAIIYAFYFGSGASAERRNALGSVDYSGDEHTMNEVADFDYNFASVS